MIECIEINLTKPETCYSQVSYIFVIKSVAESLHLVILSGVNVKSMFTYWKGLIID